MIENFRLYWNRRDKGGIWGCFAGKTRKTSPFLALSREIPMNLTSKKLRIMGGFFGYTHIDSSQLKQGHFRKYQHVKRYIL
jgi:hypothetical protein